MFMTFVQITKDKEGKNHYIRKEYEKGYWVRIPEKWWRRALAGLKPIERCILISLRVWGPTRPTKSQLARELHTTRYTIIKYLKILKGKGLV